MPAARKHTRHLPCRLICWSGAMLLLALFWIGSHVAPWSWPVRNRPGDVVLLVSEFGRFGIVRQTASPESMSGLVANVSRPHELIVEGEDADLPNDPTVRRLRRDYPTIGSVNDFANVNVLLSNGEVVFFTFNERAWVIPFWLPMIVLAAPAPWLVRRWVQDRRVSEGMCACCGYDLRATRERCPECGTPAP